MIRRLIILLLLVGCAPTIPELIPKDYQPTIYEIGMTLEEFKTQNTGIWLDKKDMKRAKYYRWEFPIYVENNLNNNPCDIIKMGYLFKIYGEKKNLIKYNSNYSCPDFCSIDHTHIANIDDYKSVPKDFPYILLKVRPFKDRDLIMHRKNCNPYPPQ